jgi:L-lactate permease
MKRIEDERILNEKMKINSRAFGLCLIALWGIILFRQFILHQQTKEYIDIFLLTISISIFVTFNNVFKGFYLTYRDKKMKIRINLISAIVATFVCLLIQIFVMKYDYSSFENILKISLQTLVFFVMYVSMQFILFRISESKANENIEE